MSNLHKPTRLGDILVERGTISRQQLLAAIEVQQTRRLFETHTPAAQSEKTELGEILIELGFINRKQLDTSLSWQKRLRKTTLVMTFIAPLLTAACGGGGGGGGSGAAGTSPSGSNNKADAPASALMVESSSSAGKSSVSSASVIPTTSSSGITVIPATPVSSDASSFSSSSISSMNLSSAKSSSSRPTLVDGAVMIYWSTPKLRENGDYLDITEIGGYELRYKLKNGKTFTSVTITDNYAESYYFDNLKGEYEFEIAAFDAEGIFSRFVPIDPS